MPDVAKLFSELGLSLPHDSEGLCCEDPSTGETIARIPLQSRRDAMQALDRAEQAFLQLRMRPGPVRGELVRQMGDVLRRHKETLAQIVCLEVGKVIEEARGEVQEMIDICDYACGLSRTLGGRTLLSERPGHRMFEQWHPLGPVLCISAFNFPVAVWAWNAAIALACGDPVIWKPSPKAPLSAIATHHLLQPIWQSAGLADVLQLLVGKDEDVAVPLVDSPRVPLVSATGSCAMGRAVAPKVAARLGRCLLELGGNNAIIVDASADLDLAVRAITFAAAGTAGQRCTTTRRLFLAESIESEMVERLVSAYRQLAERIGDPQAPETLVGPLIDTEAKQRFVSAVGRIQAEGGTILVGGRVLERPGHFVEPTLVKVPARAGQPGFAPMMEETFAPILYVRSFADDDLESAIAEQNMVEQGLSSALFSDRIRAMERFLGPAGSDCGIANVNLGTSGAEIGGAFGGEKATGGGREAGSDSWKSYMRRQTCTINGSRELPLAQGIRWG